jgi:hypothetical protein
MSEYKLTKELLRLSQSANWDEAKLEWELVDIEKVKDAEECLCGHYPINEVCLIHNKKTKANARVGNHCVKKFNNKPDKIFQAVKKIKKDNLKSVNAETLEFALERRKITQEDYDFYLNILRKRNLSEKQQKWKQDINTRLQQIL